jgi:hypothetical protein
MTDVIVHTVGRDKYGAVAISVGRASCGGGNPITSSD